MPQASRADDRTTATPAGAIRLPALAWVAAQLGLLVLIIHRYRIETPAFATLSSLALGGFVLHALAPPRFRVPLFVALSLAALGVIVGPVGAALVAAAFAAVLGACHAPLPSWARALLLAAVGTALALGRAAPGAPPSIVRVWPIAGSIFMFRAILYFLETRAGARPDRFTFAYFFLLPNVCLPLFPVVDYKALRRSYYDADAALIYQDGVRWIGTGVAHLLAWRLVYHYVVIAPAAVRGGWDLARFLSADYLLYVKVSGTFHVAIGLLHLFGFHLPPTHRRYWLASSFTDVWRRINVYWKDFMTRVVFWPVSLRMRGRSPGFTVVASTLMVFAATWLLHSYQWFWIRGAFPLRAVDGVFWGVLALLVAASSWWELRRGRERTLGKTRWTARRVLARAARSTAVFAIMCVLFSVWNSDSLAEWWAVVRRALA